MNKVDKYISPYSKELQDKLQEIRKVIREAAPDAEEIINWQVPSFYLNGNLVRFAIYKPYIGFYPGASSVQILSRILASIGTKKELFYFLLANYYQFTYFITLSHYSYIINNKIKKHPLGFCKPKWC